MLFIMLFILWITVLIILIRSYIFDSEYFLIRKYINKPNFYVYHSSGAVTLNKKYVTNSSGIIIRMNYVADINNIQIVNAINRVSICKIKTLTNISMYKDNITLTNSDDFYKYYEQSIISVRGGKSITRNLILNHLLKTLKKYEMERSS